MKHTVFQFVLITSCPSTGNHCKEPGFFLFALSLWVCIDIVEIPLKTTLLQIEWPSYISHSPYERPLLYFSVWLGHLFYAELDSVLHVWLHKYWVEWKDHHSLPASNILPKTAENTIIHLSSKRVLLTCSTWYQPRPLVFFFSVKLLSSGLAPSGS